MYNNSELYGTECGNKRPLKEMVKYSDKHHNVKGGGFRAVSSERNMNSDNPQESTQALVTESSTLPLDADIAPSGMESNHCVSSYYDKYEEIYNQNQLNSMSAQMDLSITLSIKNALHWQEIEHEADKKYAEIVMEEMAEEHKRGQYEDVMTASDGTIHCTTRGTYIDVKERSIVNMTFPELFVLESTSGESGYYKLSFEIGGTPKSVFLDAKKCDSGKYLLKKLMKEGVVFKSNKKATQIDYVERIWAMMLHQNPKRLIVAENTGWIKIGNHRYRFVEEDELVWNQIVELAL